jgi:protein-S-isoprenylcysteine O-methyltransferase Ste14
MMDTDHGPQLPLPPPVLLLTALVAAIILDWAPLRFLAPPVGLNLQVIVGALLVAGSLWLVMGAVQTFRREGTNVIPTRPALKIVTDGPYRFTRNPMYLGMVLFLLGISLIFSLEWGVILTPVLWIAFDRLIVAREEVYLTGKFGADYQALRDKTRRWL